MKSSSKNDSEEYYPDLEFGEEILSIIDEEDQGTRK